MSIKSRDEIEREREGLWNLRSFEVEFIVKIDLYVYREEVY